METNKETKEKNQDFKMKCNECDSELEIEKVQLNNINWMIIAYVCENCNFVRKISVKLNEKD
ncbi:unnamed protein product [marine sediment metagenome]|uniref:Uncharacterized protein n=1 Tax=marine sediment metagenome TaxID=412755 RepID=X1C1F9_9ZZZZ